MDGLPTRCNSFEICAFFLKHFYGANLLMCEDLMILQLPAFHPLHAPSHSAQPNFEHGYRVVHCFAKLPSRTRHL